MSFGARDRWTSTATRDETTGSTADRVGKQTLTQSLPAFPDIDQSRLEADALVWEDIQEAEVQEQQQKTEEDELEKTEDTLAGVAPRSNKGSIVVYDNENVKFGKLTCRFKVELEHSQVTSGGVNRDGDTTPSVGLLTSERKADFTAAGKLVAGSIKSSLVSGRFKLLQSLGIDIKVFEASQSTDKAKSLKQLMTMAPSLDVVKVSGWTLAAKLFPSAELARLEAAGIDVRVKAELSVPLKSLLTAAELDDLKTLANKVDDAIKRMTDLDRKIFDQVDNGADDLEKRMSQSRFRKGALGKKNRISKQELRSILKEIDELKLPAGKSKIYTKVVRHMLGKRLGSVMARVAVRAFSKLTRLVPVVGWVMLAWDLLELGYLGYKIYDGTAKFGLGGSSVSLLDIFDSEPEAGAGGGAVENEDAPDEARQTELAKLDAAQRAKLLDRGTPLGRLLKGIATAMPEGDVKVHHLTRLIQIAEAYQLTEAKVDEALKLVIEDGPQASPDKTLDTLEKILKATAARTSGTGAGTGTGDGKSKSGKGKGNGERDGKGTTGKRDRGNGDVDADGPIFDLDKVLDDPVGLGLVRVLMTSGGLTDPQIMQDTVRTPAAVVQLVEARFLGGHQKQVKNDDGSMTMEIRVEMLIYRSAGKPPELKVQSFSYGWFQDRGMVRLRDSNLQGAVASAVRKKLATGSIDSVSFDILSQKRVAGGYDVTIKLTAVRGVLLRTTSSGPERLEAGSILDTFVSDAEVKGGK